MGEYIRAWVMSLSGVITFGVICERIIPNGVYKKYIQLCVGLMLILALIKLPAEDMADIDAVLPEYLSAEEMTENMSEKETADVLRLYKTKLCDKIKEDVGIVAGVDFDVKCEVNGRDDFGRVEKLWVIVDASENKEINKGAIDIIEGKYGVDRDVISIKYIKSDTKA